MLHNAGQVSSETQFQEIYLLLHIDFDVAVAFSREEILDALVLLLYG